MKETTQTAPPPAAEDAVDNQDVRVGPDDQTIYGRAAKVLSNTVIEAEFFRHEAEANRCKAAYQKWGFLALSLLLLALAYSALTLGGLHIELPSPYNAVYEWCWAIIGAAPLVIGLALRASGVHARWLISRYRAERVRHFKFQQFLDGSYVAALADAPKAEETPEFQKVWLRFVKELNAGEGRMIDFLNRDFVPPFEIRPYPEDEILRNDVYAIYLDRRLLIQTAWFSQTTEKLEQSDRANEGMAKILFIVGAALTAFDLIRQAVGSSLIPGGASAIAAIGILLTLLSAGIRVYRSATGIPELIELYRGKHALLSYLEGEFRGKADGEPVPHQQTMHHVERVCNAELIEFLRIVRRSDFLL